MSQGTQPVPAKDEAAKPKTHPAKAYGAKSATSGHAPLSIARRETRPQDVQIEILFCGVCHSDLHQTRDEWKDVLCRRCIPAFPGTRLWAA